ncbi:hypothetical protein Tco_0825059 [Tanacetum coccineum]
MEKSVYVNLPVELEHKAYWALLACNFDLKDRGANHRSFQLYELSRALSDQAYENSVILQGEDKENYTIPRLRIRIFNVGDQFYFSTPD